MRSGVSAGDLRFRFASRTSSGLMELSLRPTIPMRAITRCLVGSIAVGDVFGDDDDSFVHRSDGSLVVSACDGTLVDLGRSLWSSSAVESVVLRWRSVRRAVACRSKWPSPSGSAGSVVSGLSCRALSSMVLRCNGLGVSSLRQGIALGTTRTVGEEGLDDFLREPPSSVSVFETAESLVGSELVRTVGVRCLDGTIDGELGLSGARSIVGRIGVFVRSESDDDLVIAAVSTESGESDGRRMYSCKRSVAGLSPSCLITFLRRSSSMMD